MFATIAIIFIPLVLGLAFLGVERSRRPKLKGRGPWLVGAAACVVATLIIASSDDGIGSLFQPVRKHQVRDMFVTAAVMALLASEAVFINGWASASMKGRAISYLLVFTCTTLVAWLVTALAFWDFVPGS
jgi:hypothetical protein